MFRKSDFYFRSVLWDRSSMGERPEMMSPVRDFWNNPLRDEGCQNRDSYMLL